jgi:beta-glucosidase
MYKIFTPKCSTLYLISDLFKHFGGCMIRLLLALASIFLITLPTTATLRGQIVDSNNSPIPNAQVMLNSNTPTYVTDKDGNITEALYSRTTFSDKDGNFVFENTSVINQYRRQTAAVAITVNKGVLSFTFPKSTNAEIHLSTVNGRTLLRDKLHCEQNRAVPVKSTSFARNSVVAYSIRYDNVILTGKLLLSANCSLRSVPVVQDTRFGIVSEPDTITIKKFGFTSRTKTFQSDVTNLDTLILQPDAIERKVDSLLALMSLAEKIGQMTQAERGTLGPNEVKDLFIGSVLSGGGSAPSQNTPAAWADMVDKFQNEALATPRKIPILYGVDAVHGHNNLKNAVLFPHNIGMGCTGNSALVKKAAEITAIEVAATGIRWTFAPCIAVPRDERWGRTYEGFAETPELTSLMADAAVRGFQGNILSSNTSIAACAKHFVGDGGTTYNSSTKFIIDQGDTRISEDELRQIHLPGYIAAIRAEVATVMASYSSFNGTKMHYHKYLLTDVLKKELGFQGFLVSDYDGIDTTKTMTYSEAIKLGINAGIDMVMVPNKYREFITTLKALVDSKDVPVSRIDDAVRRILRVKYHLGIFDKPLADRTLIPLVGQASHRAVAKECVSQSMVVLKNENSALPLKKQGQNIVVSGLHANDIGLQCGGWSMDWQGKAGAITSGTTILKGMQTLSTQITSSPSSAVTNGKDIAVVVIGENPYAEGRGDATDLRVQSSMVSLIKSYSDAKVPVVAVIISGRPLVIDDIAPMCSAIVAAWLPGTEGQGVADVLFGDYKPTGKLSMTWPKAGQFPINVGDSGVEPMYPYGHGLTY